MRHLEFLNTEWRTIQHYGVEQLRGMRFNGSALNGYRNQKSPYRGKHQGLSPASDNDVSHSRAYL